MSNVPYTTVTYSSINGPGKFWILVMTPSPDPKLPEGEMADDLSDDFIYVKYNK